MEGGRRGCGACSGLERQQWGLRRLCLLAASPSPSPVSESVGSASPCNAAPPKTGGRTPRPSLPDSANSNDRFQSPLGREPRGRHLRRLTGLHSNCPALQRARADWGCSERAANCPLRCALWVKNLNSRQQWRKSGPSVPNLRISLTKCF